MDKTLESIFGLTTPYGLLMLYGDNMEQCVPYINDVVDDSVESVCEYCMQHNLRIFHKPNRSIGGFFEVFRVQRLTRKYSVYSSWKELQQYFGI